MITLTKQQYIELLEYKLIVLQQANETDSTWNYGIEELENEIKTLKSLVD
jgi:hypothetical protein